MTELRHFSTSTEARFARLGTPGPHVRTLWMVCHGYGQLAEYFIRPFETLVDETTLVVAPEALHRFYLAGVKGRVGASWMTKEDRETDIRNYVRYLDGLYRSVIETLDESRLTVNVLGFSQGGATVCRWLANRQVPVSNLVLWASTFPPDFNFEADRAHLNQMNIQVVVGDADEYLNTSYLDNQRAFLDQNGIQYTFTPFQGTHRIDAKVLLRLAKRLADQ